MDEDVEVNCRTEMARSFPPEKDPTQATHQCRLPMMRPSSKPQSAIHELTFMPQYSASGAQQTSQAAVSALCGARRSIGNRRVHGSPSSRVQSTRNNILSQDPYDSTHSTSQTREAAYLRGVNTCKRRKATFQSVL